MAAEPDLSRLILDAKGDRSYERMSLDCGGLPTDKRLQQMATNQLRAFPDVATIRGLARGTGTTETAVVLAAARSLGLRVHSGTDPTALVIGGADDLRPEQKETVIALVRVFRETNTDAHHRRLETLLASSEQRYEAIRELVATVPIDGTDRSRERAIIVRAALEAYEELKSLRYESSGDVVTAELLDRFSALRVNWKVMVEGLVELAAKYPPFTSTDQVTTKALNGLIHSSTGSGKASQLIDFARTASRVLPVYAVGTHADPEDYDEKAASWSPEPAGQPEPEQP